MKKMMILWLGLMLILAACGGDAVEQSAAEGDVGGETAVSDTTRLSDDYDEALSVQSQLAVGTLQLEETEEAIDETLAAELLPLWQAVQSLGNSETAAEAEITAVINQIQSSMTAEQITAISTMQLTSDSLTALVEDGTLSFGQGGFGRQGGGTTEGGGFTPPGGGAGGGIPGGGGRPEGGIPGGGAGDLSEDDIATRQAERNAGDAGGIQDQAMINAVIRLLETKTGQVTERVDPFAEMWKVLNEATDLTTEEIQTQLAEGTTLVELIEAHDGDVEAIHAELVESLADSPIAQRQDLDEYVTNLLNNSNDNEE